MAEMVLVEGEVTGVERDWRILHYKQRQAAWLIAQGYSYADTMRKLRTSNRTLARWRMQPEFQAVLRALMVFYADESFNRVNSVMPVVLENLKDLALNAERDSDRISASKSLISSWAMFKDHLDRDMVSELARRVSQLETEQAGELAGFNEGEILSELRATSEKRLTEMAAEVEALNA